MLTLLRAWVARLFGFKRGAVAFAPRPGNLCPLGRDSCADCELCAHEVEEIGGGYQVIILCKHPEAPERGLAVLRYYTGPPERKEEE